MSRCYGKSGGFEIDIFQGPKLRGKGYVCIYLYIYKDRQTDKKGEIQIYSARQTDKQTDRQHNRYDVNSYRRTDLQTDRQTTYQIRCKHIDGQTDRQTT